MVDHHRHACLVELLMFHVLPMALMQTLAHGSHANTRLVQCHAVVLMQNALELRKKRAEARNAEYKEKAMVRKLVDWSSG